MTTMCNNTTNIFQEAINHCRWKSTLHNILKNIEIQNYKNKSFDEIITEIYNMCENINGIGMLTIYDISSTLCRIHNININYVYIIGSGPKRAIQLLNIKTKTHKINNKIQLKYVNISDIITAFNDNKFNLDEKMKTITNGDVFETFICIWQKTK